MIYSGIIIFSGMLFTGVDNCLDYIASMTDEGMGMAFITIDS
jgi:hypothetical protein